MNSFSFQKNDELDSEIYKQLEKLVGKNNSTLSSRTRVGNRLDSAYDIIKYNLKKKASIPVDEIDFFIFGINRNKERYANTLAKRQKSLDVEEFDTEVEKRIAQEGLQYYKDTEDIIMFKDIMDKLEDLKTSIYFKYEVDLSECIRLAKLGVPSCIEVLQDITKDDSLRDFFIYIIENKIEIGGLDYAKVFGKKRGYKVSCSKTKSNKRFSDKIHTGLCDIQLLENKRIRQIVI